MNGHLSDLAIDRWLAGTLEARTRDSAALRERLAALELAQVLWLQNSLQIRLSSPPETARDVFDRLGAQLPSQTVRSEEQIELQQFATPPHLAWLAVRACAFGASEGAPEPSAGTGMLAGWAEGNAVKVVPIHAELTTQEAADMLNVSRPHLVKLLESGALAFHKTGKHRRIRFPPLKVFKNKQNRQEGPRHHID